MCPRRAAGAVVVEEMGCGARRQPPPPPPPPPASSLSVAVWTAPTNASHKREHRSPDHGGAVAARLPTCPPACLRACLPQGMTTAKAKAMKEMAEGVQRIQKEFFEEMARQGRA